MDKYLLLVVIFTFLLEVQSKIDTDYVEATCRSVPGANKIVKYKLNSTAGKASLRLRPRPDDSYSKDQECFLTVDSVLKQKVLINFVKLDFNVDSKTCESYVRDHEGTSLGRHFTECRRVTGASEFFVPDAEDGIIIHRKVLSSTGQQFTDFSIKLARRCPRIIKIEIGRKPKHCSHDQSKGSLTTKSQGQFITLYYKTTFEDGAGRVGFDIVATEYKEAPCDDNFKFACNNTNCISESLKCDGYNNCEDNSDENGCPSMAGPQQFAASLPAMMIWMSIFLVKNIEF